MMFSGSGDDISVKGGNVECKVRIVYVGVQYNNPLYLYLYLSL